LLDTLGELGSGRCWFVRRLSLLLAGRGLFGGSLFGLLGEYGSGLPGRFVPPSVERVDAHSEFFDRCRKAAAPAIDEDG
jgi:hypothetical protein